MGEENEFCTNCGSELNNDREKINVGFCINCGQKIEDENLKFCTNCGSELHAEKDTQHTEEIVENVEEEEEEKKPPLRKGLLFGIGGILIIFLLFFVFVSGSDEDKTDKVSDNDTAVSDDANTNTDDTTYEDNNKNTSDTEEKIESNEEKTAKTEELQGVYFAEATFEKVINNNEEQNDLTGKIVQEIFSIISSDQNDNYTVDLIPPDNTFLPEIEVKSADNKNYSGEYVSERMEVQADFELTPEKESVMVGEYTMKDYYSENEFAAKIVVYPLEETTLDKLVGSYDIEIEGFNVQEGESSDELFNKMVAKTEEYEKTKITAEIINKKSGTDGIIAFSEKNKSENSLYSFPFNDGTLAASLQESNNELFNFEEMSFYGYCYGQDVILHGRFFIKLSDNEIMRIFFTGTKK